jgi:L-cysteine/cystine lyase
MTFDLAAVRAQLPVTDSTAYLNIGTAGPWPTPVVEAVEHALRREAVLGRASPRGLPDFPAVLQETRAALAGWVGANADELALTGSTTEGVNVVIWGVDWQPGDAALTTSIEHRGVLVPLRQVARRRGVTLAVADVGHGEPAIVLDAIQRALTPRTRLVALSHVSFSTGACLPIREIADLAHKAGAALLVDGAQAVGALPVDVGLLNVDYYAFPGQKWLCGPEGTGGLYVRRERQAELEATFVGTRSARPAAGRYEYATPLRPGVHGLHAALAWLDSLGRETLFARTRELAEACYERLASRTLVELLTPAYARAGLVHFRLPGADLERCVAALAQHGVTIRSVADTQSLRVSCAFFNTHAELDGLLEGLDPQIEALHRAHRLHTLPGRAEH